MLQRTCCAHEQQLNVRVYVYIYATSTSFAFRHAHILTVVNKERTSTSGSHERLQLDCVRPCRRPRVGHNRGARTGGDAENGQRIPTQNLPVLLHNSCGVYARMDIYKFYYMSLVYIYIYMGRGGLYANNVLIYGHVHVQEFSPFLKRRAISEHLFGDISHEKRVIFKRKVVFTYHRSRDQSDPDVCLSSSEREKFVSALISLFTVTCLVLQATTELAKYLHTGAD